VHLKLLHSFYDRFGRGTPAKAVRRGWCPHQPATILNAPIKKAL